MSLEHAAPFGIIGAALLVFPALALGLSGFETGVVVMPLVKGDAADTESAPLGRIRNAKKLLTTAALIMSVMLIGSSLVTTLLIPHEQFEPGGEANGRALAYLAHDLLGDGFGTLYDASTIGILWFAGASAMAGLLNIVPRYLPRYGMAPDWARSTRPLVLVLWSSLPSSPSPSARASTSQAGAYATGVLALMTSAAIAVFLTECVAGTALRPASSPSSARSSSTRSRSRSPSAPRGSHRARLHRAHRRHQRLVAHQALDRATRPAGCLRRRAPSSSPGRRGAQPLRFIANKSKPATATSTARSRRHALPTT